MKQELFNERFKNKNSLMEDLETRIVLIMEDFEIMIDNGRDI